MNTSNRPIVKEIEYELTHKITEYSFNVVKPFWVKKDYYYSNDSFPHFYRVSDEREVERPMNDTEYIEYLEKENQELKNQLRDRDFSDKNYQEYLRIETEYQCLLANNNELKGRIALQQSSYEKKFRELNDKLLKVVESVFKEFYLVPVKDTYEEYCTMKNPYWSYYGSLDSFNKLMEHLLQEIRKAMENE